eukprot:SAG31_NODE_3556_length_4126_cov_1.701266_4_plen_185_part_00
METGPIHKQDSRILVRPHLHDRLAIHKNTTLRQIRHYADSCDWKAVLPSIASKELCWHSGGSLGLMTPLVRTLAKLQAQSELFVSSVTLTSIKFTSHGFPWRHSMLPAMSAVPVKFLNVIFLMLISGSNEPSGFASAQQEPSGTLHQGEMCSRPGGQIFFVTHLFSGFGVNKWHHPRAGSVQPQ